ncbi:hypothetical protein FGK63_12725 [Ruegeria sediminis]|uniref:Uncharacterized protein n=1 Tax=Ruegeria sediminis TaxID=2583820 RepID=A0ABY2WWU3_9RHOB|nr:hypothetical protein [Ruegeria sediminis]TMV06975.1 hypothetical protein FGK63_12725 [Ruegeria sediminis]
MMRRVPEKDNGERFQSLSRKEIRAALRAIKEGDLHNLAAETAYDVAWRVFKDAGCDIEMRDVAMDGAIEAIRTGCGDGEIWSAGWNEAWEFQREIEAEEAQDEMNEYLTRRDHEDEMWDQMDEYCDR